MEIVWRPYGDSFWLSACGWIVDVLPNPGRRGTGKCKSDHCQCLAEVGKGRAFAAPRVWLRSPRFSPLPSYADVAGSSLHSARGTPHPELDRSRHARWVPVPELVSACLATGRIIAAACCPRRLATGRRAPWRTSVAFGSSRRRGDTDLRRCGCSCAPTSALRSGQATRNRRPQGSAQLGR